jgi:hypothetical protein
MEKLLRIVRKIPILMIPWMVRALRIARKAPPVLILWIVWTLRMPIIRLKV